MKHLKTYRLFESEGRLSPEIVDLLDVCCVPYPNAPSYKTRADVEKEGRPWGRIWSINPETGLVDVDGSVDFNRKEPGRIVMVHPMKQIVLEDIDFGRVEGHFNCRNKNVKSLIGAPREVGGTFIASSCLLKSLVGGPKVVGAHYECGENSLRDLVGAPEFVGGAFFCSENDLQSLEGAPKVIEGQFRFKRYGFETIDVPAGEWGPEKIIQLYLEGNEKQKRLVEPLFDTIVTPEALQVLVDESPSKMLMSFRNVLGRSSFSGVRWPGEIETEREILTGLDSLGI